MLWRCTPGAGQGRRVVTPLLNFLFFLFFFIFRVEGLEGLWCVWCMFLCCLFTVKHFLRIFYLQSGQIWLIL